MSALSRPACGRTCRRWATSLLLLTWTGLATIAVAATSEFKAAAGSFSIRPEVGAPASHSRVDQVITQVVGDLETTVLLFEQGEDRMVLVASPLSVDRNPTRAAIVAVITEELGVAPEAVVTSSSHNHTLPLLRFSEKPGVGMPAGQGDPALALGRDFVAKLRDVAAGLTSALEPVTVEWGTAEENRITYNRRGYRRDGSTYFVREEDRVKLGEGYHGLIDPDASVVVLRGAQDNVVGAMAFFTGHPVTAYNPERQISFGQWHQVATKILSEHLDDAPVAFLQGCGGDINSKYMLTGSVDQGIEMGRQLGATFIIAADQRIPSERRGFEWSLQPVDIPLAPLPSVRELEADLAEIDDFVARGRAGDPDTLECVGMNFPLALTPAYRARLVELVRPWYVWALSQHREKTLHQVPTRMPIEIVVARWGDVGYVGLPFEPFVRTGLKIKDEAHLAHVLPVGYTNGALGYIPDATAVNDREYQAGFFRYRGNVPPYREPGADEAAMVAIKVLNTYAK